MKRHRVEVGAALRAGRLIVLLWLASWASPGWAAAPTAEALLGPDALAVATVPDWQRFVREANRSPFVRLLSDPAMKPFVEKFKSQWQSQVLTPLERQYGFRWSDYSGLIDGQATFAITSNGWGAEPEAEPGFLLLLDAGARAEDMKRALETLRKNWSESGKKSRVESIRNVEFTALIFSPAELRKSLETVFGDGEDGEEAPEDADAEETPLEWFLGQSETLLILGNATAEIEKVLARQSGGSAGALRDNASFAPDYGKTLRASSAYGWINLKTILDVAMKNMKEAAGEAEVSLVSNVAAALGLSALESASVAVARTDDGDLGSVNVRVPAGARKGLLQVLAIEPKDAAPPPFIPADALNFYRTRLDLRKVWSGLESTLAEINPQWSGMLNLVMESVGKNIDPDFDLRQNLIANLGDDIVTYGRAPRGRTFEDLNQQPSLVMINSPNPEQLATAIKALAALLPGPTDQAPKVSEREFLGRTLYTVNLPSPAASGPSKLTFVANAGYVVLSTEASMVEELLRGNPSESLRDLPGLASAAQNVGGMGMGMFGYENDRQTLGYILEILRNESGKVSSLFGNFPLAGRVGPDGAGAKFDDWIDLSLLPPFEQIQKYFHFSLYGGGATSEGFSFKGFTPTPPGL